MSGTGRKGRAVAEIVLNVLEDPAARTSRELQNKVAGLRPTVFRIRVSKIKRISVLNRTQSDSFDDVL